MSHLQLSSPGDAACEPVRSTLIKMALASGAVDCQEGLIISRKGLFSGTVFWLLRTVDWVIGLRCEVLSRARLASVIGY